MKQKIGLVIFLAVFLVAGVTLTIVQDIRYQKPEFWMFAIVSSFAITLSLAGIIFVFRKLSFKMFLLVTVLSNMAVCIFHSFKQAPEGWEDALTSEEFFEKSKKILRRKFDERSKV